MGFLNYLERIIIGLYIRNYINKSKIKIAGVRY